VTATKLEDELALSEGNWRRRLITFAVLLLGVGGVALAIYYFAFRSNATTATRSTEEIPVVRATISQTLSISGVADAQLNSNLTFQATGKIAEVNVKVGDAARQGDVLASIESDDLVNAVSQAQANQRAAQLKLDDLLSGSTAAEIAAADQALVSAQSNLTKAENDYDTLVGGGTAADLAAAQQGVSAAEAQLASAKSARTKLDDTPSAADKAAAEAGVASAQSALTAAQNSSASAQNTVTAADASLKSAETSYCASDPAPAFCTTAVSPISSADATLMTAALEGAHATLASGVIAANSAFLNAQNSADSAAAAVTSAQQALTSAEEKLDSVNDGPTSADVAAADAAVTSAESALTAAQQKLATVQGGADAQRSTLAAAVLSAQAAVDAAQTKDDEAHQGATANAIAQARQAVETAGLVVEAAQIRLRNAQIIAPFDGVVAAVNAHVGEFAGAAGGSSTAAPIVLLTPNLLRFKMNVQETDYANIKLDQTGMVIFDALPGRPFVFKITSIGSAPITTSGVVTYEVDATLTIPPGSLSPAAGMNGNGLITTDSKPNVLVVPARAIKRRGTDQIVSMKRANGDVEEQVITTGVSDANNVEVLTGLTEGDVVEVVTLTTAKAGSAPTPQPTVPSGLR
jgi:multidrug efflux pump subunit AcrA (membrane-fusion protein)